MESSLSFLVEDRHLDNTKRRWIKSNIRKRECVSYAPSTGAGEDSEQQTPCRCGRMQSEHVKIKLGIKSTHYRQFSEDFPTDVYLEVVNTEFNEGSPITYAPKQVIRLAADLEIEVLRQLIGSIWRMPKANFLVSLVGTYENKQDNLLQNNLEILFSALANPGNVTVTMCTRDPCLRELALKACELESFPGQNKLHPACEVVPMVFVEWGELTAQEREVLLQATKRESRAEDEEIVKKVPVLASHKGYFLLTDYGVQSLPDAATETTTRLAPTAQEQDTRIAFASGSLDNLHLQHPPNNKDTQSSGHQSTEVNRDSQSSALESGGGRKPIRPGSEITTSTYSAYPAPYSPPPPREGRCAGQSLASHGTDGQSKPLLDSSKDASPFSFFFPSPLRRVVEIVLQEHSKDPGGQGSLMVVSGCQTFLDLASMHGAVVSGVPVVIIKSSNEEQPEFLKMLEELDQQTGSSGDEHGLEKRQGMVNEVTLTKLNIKERIQLLKDFKQYQPQAERVVRDLLLRRHLLTVCDLSPAHNGDDRLLHAAVEAFMKAMPKEEATTFFKKHTLNLTGDMYNAHPVQTAQRKFQTATLKAAVTLNRPDLLDIIVKHGFVTEDDVFRERHWEKM